MTASQMRIAETIDAFYGDAGAKDGVSRSYRQAVEDLDAETIKALDGPYRTTVLEPISRFCAYFPDVNECKWPSSDPPFYYSLPDCPLLCGHFLQSPTSCDTNLDQFLRQVLRNVATNSSTMTRYGRG